MTQAKDTEPQPSMSCQRPKSTPDKNHDRDDDMSGKQGSQPPRNILDIERAVRQNQKVFYKVIIEGQKHRPWVWKEDIPDHIIDNFHKTRTMKGTAKKHKKTTSYFTKQ